MHRICPLSEEEHQKTRPSRNRHSPWTTSRKGPAGWWTTSKTMAQRTDMLLDIFVLPASTHSTPKGLWPGDGQLRASHDLHASKRLENKVTTRKGCYKANPIYSPLLKEKFDTPKQCRRKTSLMRKASEYSKMCDADVCFVRVGRVPSQNGGKGGRPLLLSDLLIHI